MDKFLEEFPEYSDKSRLFRILQDNSDSLDKHLGILKLSQIKALVNTVHFKSPQMRRAIKHIIKKEAHGTKKMVYRVISGHKVSFSDIKTKALFYRELPEFRKLFKNKSRDSHFLIADLFCRQLYSHEDVSEMILNLIDSLPITDKIFYSLSLQPVLNYSQILSMLRQIPTNLCSDIELGCILLAVMELKEEEKYSFIASSLLYSSDTEKIRIIRAIPPECDPKLLTKAILSSCFRDPETANKTYLTCLRLIKLIGLEYRECLKLLYAWMRFFLKYFQFDRFCDLFEDVSRAKLLDEEFCVYEAFYRYLKGEFDMKHLQEVVDSHIEKNDYSSNMDIRGIFQEYVQRNE